MFAGDKKRRSCDGGRQKSKLEIRPYTKQLLLIILLMCYSRNCFFFSNKLSRRFCILVVVWLVSLLSYFLLLSRTSTKRG